MSKDTEGKLGQNISFDDLEQDLPNKKLPNQNLVQEVKKSEKVTKQGEEKKEEKGPSLLGRAAQGAKDFGSGTLDVAARGLKMLTGGVVDFTKDSESKGGGYQEPFDLTGYLLTKLMTLGKYIKDNFTSSVTDEKLTQTSLKDGVDGVEKGGDKTASSQTVNALGETFGKYLDSNSSKRDMARESGLADVLADNAKYGANKGKSGSEAGVVIEHDSSSLTTVGGSSTNKGSGR